MQTQASEVKRLHSGFYQTVDSSFKKRTSNVEKNVMLKWKIQIQQILIMISGFQTASTNTRHLCHYEKGLVCVVRQCLW